MKHKINFLNSQVKICKCGDKIYRRQCARHLASVSHIFVIRLTQGVKSREAGSRRPSAQIILCLQLEMPLDMEHLSRKRDRCSYSGTGAENEVRDEQSIIKLEHYHYVFYIMHIFCQTIQAYENIKILVKTIFNLKQSAVKQVLMKNSN